MMLSYCYSIPNSAITRDGHLVDLQVKARWGHIYSISIDKPHEVGTKDTLLRIHFPVLA